MCQGRRSFCSVLMDGETEMDERLGRPHENAGAQLIREEGIIANEARRMTYLKNLGSRKRAGRIILLLMFINKY